MRIVLDARYLKSDYSGIGTYSQQLIEALGKLDQSNEFFVLVHSSFKGDLDVPDNFEILTDGARPVSLRSITTLGPSLRKLDADVLHSLMPLTPLLWGKKQIATLFDLQPLLDTQFSALRSVPAKFSYELFYRLAYPACLRKADNVLCISYATKNDLIRLWPDLIDKVFVVHAGITEEAFVPPSEELIERVREKYGLPERYLFYLGSTRPNKNLARMVDAFEAFLKRHPEHDDLHFVMVLKQDRFFDPLFSLIRERGLLRRIQIHEQVSSTEKRVFLHQASLLYFATMYEGFGLPVLEAQALGIPVLASTHGSLPEVAGKSALLADPTDTENLTEMLETFFADSELRVRMAEEGPENARKFSWESAAKEMLDMYQHVLA